MMRLWNLLTSQFSLIALQQLVSVWFLIDFFLAQDSLTADALWGTKHDHGCSADILKLRDEYCSSQALKPPSFDKIILLVIDALGTEFVPAISKSQHVGPNKMPFLERAIHEGSAMGFTAKAATPTVTMPRLKAIVSGTIPSFVDLIYNLAGDVSKFEDDNLLSIAKQNNKSLVFYGDDTWLSLFKRGIFTRAQETFSFFASDYTSVDTNVTNYALPETKLGEKTDWDLLILHYLGLDHIGHVFGYNEGPMIDKKLLEMDSVIENVHTNMAKSSFRTLIVVCGDHGMSEQGNHGGGTSLETNTAVIFLPINRNFNGRHATKSSNILQIDLAVTLALLSGMQIPRSSKGIAIESLLNDIWFDDKIRLSCAALDNLIELLNLIDPADLPLREEFSNISIKHINTIENFSDSSGNLFKLARSLQERLLESVARRSNQLLIVMALVGVTFLSLAGLKKACQHLKMTILMKHEKLICLVIFITPIVMHGSTDFIESERLFWIIFTFGATIMSLISAIISRQPKINRADPDQAAIVLFSKVMTLSKYGFARLFILSYALSSSWTILRKSNPILGQYISPVVSILFICNTIRKRCDLKRYKPLVVSLIGLTILLTTLIEEPSHLDDNTQVFYQAVMQKVALIVVLIYAVINMFSSPTNATEQNQSSRMISKLASSWLCLALLLCRRHNFFFLALNVILESSLNALADQTSMSQILRSLLYLSFAQAAFFNQGHTNSFASIDIKPAFYGQTEFSMILSIPLVAFATFSTQIYWYLKMFQRIHDSHPPYHVETEHTFGLAKWAGIFIIIRNFLSLSYYMFVCLVLRNHLFIWSVLSPKLIFQFVTNNVLLITILMISNMSAKSSQSLKQSKISQV